MNVWLDAYVLVHLQPNKRTGAYHYDVLLNFELFGTIFRLNVNINQKYNKPLKAFSATWKIFK